MEISLKAEIARSNMKIKDIAAGIQMPAPTFYRKLNTGKLTFDETVEGFKILGLHVKVEKFLHDR